MRTISANTLDEITKQYNGAEPVTIIAISWDGISKFWYADRDVGSISGKIMSVSDMDAVVNVSGSSDSEEISIILDDTSGDIKTLMDANDIHKASAWVYQYFYGMDLDEKFLLFKGQINSPITWNEGNRRISFNIVSQLEENEIGFSADEGQFTNVADELIGVPWPMVFGSVTGVRALRLTRLGAAITAQGVALPDVTLLGRVEALNANVKYQQEQVAIAETLISHFETKMSEATRDEDSGALDYWEGNRDKAITARENALKNIDKFEEKKKEVQADYTAQLGAGSSSDVKIIDSDSPLPTGRITVKIGGARFTGYNDGDTISFTQHAISWSTDAGRQWHTYHSYGYVPRELSGELLDLPRATGIQFPGSYTRYQYPGDSGWISHTVFPHLRLDGSVSGTSLGYFYANSGSTIEVVSDEPQEYIVSLIPGTVTRVSAYYNNNGLRVLRAVPKEYYTSMTKSYGSVSAVVIDMPDALSKIGNWEDQIYVDFTSSVGSNTVSIMEYLITTYSNLTYDATSFAAVKTKLQNYPSSFALYDRKNLLTLLKEIAWQCRCSIKLINDVFYLTYLSETPTPVDTIVTTDITVDTLELGYTPTEDLVTKMECTWESTGAQEKQHRVILKNNVSKYGVQEASYNFYIYNYLDAVIKSATFWLIRYSNTWRKAVFTTPLTKLNIETLDAVSLDIDFLSSSSVKSIVESAIYDSANNGINFECWVPILAGTDSEYVFAYPASADSTQIFQADAPRRYTIGPGLINWNRADNDPYSLKSEEGDRRFSNLGSRFPSDANDKKPALEQKTKVPGFSSLPILGTATSHYDQIGVLSTDILAESSGITEIDIRTTIISDSETGKSTTLDTFFDRINNIADEGEDEENVLMVSPEHYVVGDDDGATEQISTFHYRYDTDTEIWGAGTAFLRP